MYLCSSFVPIAIGLQKYIILSTDRSVLTQISDMYDLKELVEQTPTNRLVYLYRAILHRALGDALGIVDQSEKFKQNFIKNSQDYIGSKDFHEVCFHAKTNPNEIINLYEKLKKEDLETRKSIAKRLQTK